MRAAVLALAGVVLRGWGLRVIVVTALASVFGAWMTTLLPAVTPQAKELLVRSASLSFAHAFLMFVAVGLGATVLRQERRGGRLDSLRCLPVHPWAMVLGKALGSLALLALVAVLLWGFSWGLQASSESPPQAIRAGLSGAQREGPAVIRRGQRWRWSFVGDARLGSGEAALLFQLRSLPVPERSALGLEGVDEAKVRLVLTRGAQRESRALLIKSRGVTLVPLPTPLKEGTGALQVLLENVDERVLLRAREGDAVLQFSERSRSLGWVLGEQLSLFYVKASVLFSLALLWSLFLGSWPAAVVTLALLAFPAVHGMPKFGDAPSPMTVEQRQRGGQQSPWSLRKTSWRLIRALGRPVVEFDGRRWLMRGQAFPQGWGRRQALKGLGGMLVLMVLVGLSFQMRGPR